MTSAVVSVSSSVYANPLPVPTIDEQLASIVEDGREELYLCTRPWALRHKFIHRETGEVKRARCDCWHCLYCGPRKVDLWRQLVKAVEPTHFITLTKVGWTVEEAARVLTTVVQRLRRGYRSQDPTRKGYRPAYPIEYFAVLERHADFEQNGFHWHLLVKGVAFLPNQHVSDALCSATKGRSYITKTEGIYNSASIGYVTKYLTKYITEAERGTREVERERLVIEQDDEGHIVERIERETVEVTSKARRIRYSRAFFPVPVAELRKRLFAAGEADTGAADTGAESGTDIGPGRDEEAGEGEASGTEERPVSAWAFVEVGEATTDIREYRRRKREALREVLADRRERGARLNGRILTLWDYQRRERRVLHWQGKAGESARLNG